MSKGGEGWGRTKEFVCKSVLEVTELEKVRITPTAVFDSGVEGGTEN